MNLSTSTAKSPDENLQEEIGKLLGHRMTPRPQIEPDTPRPQFENDIERIMSAVATNFKFDRKPGKPNVRTFQHSKMFEIRGRPCGR